jgi:hypothetical protein
MISELRTQFVFFEIAIPDPRSSFPIDSYNELRIF